MSELSFAIKTLRQTRTNYLNLIESYSLDQLNKIPQGFNNNMIWNFGHAIVTQQLLCYKLAGEEMYIDDEMVNRYRKGSKPGLKVNEAEVDLFKSYAMSFVDKLDTDSRNGKFQSYKDYPTSFGVTLTSISDAVAFNNLHEGMHFGTLLALKKLV